MNPTNLMNWVQKWEAKLLETRVADFARVQGSTVTTASPDAESLKPINSSPPERLTIQQNQYSHPFPPPSHGLALPGQIRQANGYGQDMKVKLEPDELLRIRGGAVCTSLHKCRITS